jgi:hypothetical protein
VAAARNVLPSFSIGRLVSTRAQACEVIFPDDCTEIDRKYSPGADIRLSMWGVPVRVSVKERRPLLFFNEKAKSRQEAVRTHLA